ncbi:uncharacterized protein [Rutidosis leptorrhynchoides]|uniref:uncharacterized protein n=1 Tax=Rutidosis leptorrhynchoides TaxID=125765 RepID=UPI003A9993C5
MAVILLKRKWWANPGGQLIIWNLSCFDVTDSFISDFFIGIRGVWKGSGKILNVINVYGPHDDHRKQVFWDQLQNKISSNSSEPWLICGDFNEVRSEDERLNCQFIESRAKKFNDFINNSKLIDIPLGGRLFTRVSDDGIKFNKLDRFLVNDSFHNLWSGLSVVALDRGKSDHCPIILKEDNKNFGPKPIKVFDEWFDIEEDEIDALKSVANALEQKAEKGLITDEERKQWLDTRKEWFQKEKIKVNMLKQKARVHPCTIKEEAFLHFKSRFEEHPGDRPSLSDLSYPSLSPDEANDLEAPISEAEVFEAIQDCGSSKAPGPDGFNLGFFKKFWDIIKEDVLNAITWFWEKGEFLKGCNASFVTLIPKKRDPITISDYRPISLIGSFYKIVAKILSNRLRRVIPKLIGSEQSAFLKEHFILDGVLIANESIEYLKKHKKRSLIFKVDFEKAFDCLKWDFLLEVMSCMGFGSKWCEWIRGCLKSASISILINGSPTREFSIGRGVRQGDPLSPFLFIIAAEGLNILTKAAVDRGIFQGVKIGNDKVLISHLQYADDTIFFGEWSNVNARNLINILKCFELASGLKVNFHKSCLYGVGVGSVDVESLASRMKCQAGKFPFIYLGLPIGAKMNIVGDWLNLGSLKGKNLALLGKWWWRFKTETNCLWTKIIKSIYGIDGGLRSGDGLAHQSTSGVWNNIIRAGNVIESCHVNFKNSFKKSIGDGKSSLFWKDNWCGSMCFKEMFSRLYRLESKKEALVSDRLASCNDPNPSAVPRGANATVVASHTRVPTINHRVTVAVSPSLDLDAVNQNLSSPSEGATVLTSDPSSSQTVFPVAAANSVPNGSNAGAAGPSPHTGISSRHTLTWEWIRMPTGRTLTELLELENLLNSVHLDLNSQENWKWDLAKNGVFTVKKLTSPHR